MFYLRSWLRQLAQRLSLPTGLRSRKKVVRLLRKRAGIRLNLEELESRITPGSMGSTDFWNGSGDWNANLGNWTNGVAPTPTQTVEIQSGSLTLSSGSETVGAIIVVPSATLNVTGGSTLTAQSSGTAVTDNGTINVASGTLNANGAYTQASGAVLDIGIGGTTAGTFGQVAVSGAASLAGTLTLNPTNGYSAPFGSTYQPLTYGSETGTFAVSSTFTGTSFGAQYAAGNLTLTAVPLGTTTYWVGPNTGGAWDTAADWSNGFVPTTSDNVFIGSSATITLGSDDVSSNLEIGGNAAVNFIGNGSYNFGANASGNLTVDSSATLTISTGVTIQGHNGSIGGSGSVVNDGGAIEANNSGDAITIDPQTFTNNGSIIASNGATITITPTTFTNTGSVISEYFGSTVDVNPTTLTNVSNGVLTGGLWEINGTSTIDLHSSITTNDAFVTLIGPSATFGDLNGLAANQGTFELVGGAVFNTAGDLGNTGTIFLYPGTLNVDGNYTQAAGAILDLGIGITGFGQVNVDGTDPQIGTATLNGTLQVDSINEFIPTAASTYQLLTYGGSTGAFNTTTINLDPAGGPYTLAVNATNLTLSAENPLVVTTTADNGDNNNPVAGSLRAAITYAENNGGGTITFAIPAGDSTNGAFTIQPLTALPDITSGVSIDGTSEAAFLGETYTSPIIVLNGALAGSYATGPYVTGLTLTGSGSTIQGLVVNQFSYDGIDITGSGATGDVIAGDYIGLDVTGTTAGVNESLGNTYDLVIENGASNNTIGGVTAAARNVISGANQSFGVLIYGSATTGNVVEGNYIGLDATGSTSMDANGNSLGNDIDVRIENASDNTIGGTTASARNIISGSSNVAVDIEGSGVTGNVVEGNYIGTDATGSATVDSNGHSLGNASGVFIGSSASGNTVGGTTAGAGNVISGNGLAGVYIGFSASSNYVQGNIIGLNAAGTAALGHQNYGVLLYQDGTDNTIGGTTAAARNIISGNTDDGVSITGSGTTGNVVEGNYIGTDITGTTSTGTDNRALGNDDGVEINDGAANNTIGGTTAGSSNVISGNTDDGVAIIGSGTSGNLVQGNLIGTDITQVNPLGNGGDGVDINSGASDNTVNADNLIAYNTADGVQIGASPTDDATGNDVQANYILSNSYLSNSYLGIDLGGDGPTANDSLGHTGPNLFQDYPVITSALIDPNGDLIVTYANPADSGSSSNGPITVDVYVGDASGEGESLVGSSTSFGTVNLGNAADLGVPAGQYLVATATDAAGNTSEFSPAVTVTGLPTSFVVVNTNDSGPGSLRQAVVEADYAPGLTITFDPSLAGQTITLTSGELPQIISNTTIDAEGVANLAVSGGGNFRVFDVASGATVSITGLMIEDGNSNSGSSDPTINQYDGYFGGAVINQGNLTLVDSTIADSGAESGGGIGNDGTMTLIDSTVTGNSSASHNNGGGIANNGVLTLNGATISNNRSFYGSGIFNYGSGLINITNSTFDGNTVGNYSYQGAISNNGTVIITGSTFTNNAGSAGAAIDNQGGATLTLTDSTISGNSVGAGINNSGTATLTGDAILGNLAGGVANSGTLSVTDSTISGNTASGNGGGIDNKYLHPTNYYGVYSPAVTGVLTVTDSTISGNSAVSGGGVYNATGAAFTLQNTIIVGNSASSAGPNISGAVTTDNGSNLIGDVSGASGFVATDLQNSAYDAPGSVLAPLANNGGPTQTMALVAGSPALAAGVPIVGVTTDQRGVGRPLSNTDIGAFQTVDPLLVYNTNDSGDGSLRAAVDYANANGGTITFNIPTTDPGYSGGDYTITLTSGSLAISSDMTIVGPGAGVLTISGENASPIFNVASDVTASISGLSMIDGNGTFGGALFNEGTLTVSNSTFANNTAPSGYGGAVYNRALVGHPIDGLLTLTNDTFSSNSASHAGAIDNWAGGDVVINNSTFDGNSATQNGGAILNEWGTVEIADSTFTGNTAGLSGGAIMNESGQAFASVTVIDSTISGNSAVAGGGIENQLSLTLANTIVSGNTASFRGPDIDGAITTDNGHNLLGNALHGTTSGPGDVFIDTPLLAPLGNNGGTTETMALLPGSPALGVGHPSGPDQRGFAANGDIGAFEDQLTVLGGTPLSATEGELFSGTLTEFRDADPNAPSISISAVINWGDGFSCTVTTSGAGDDKIVSFGSGFYGVVGSHTYAEQGGYSVTVTITDADGNAAATFLFIQVQDAPLTAGNLTPPSAIEGEAFSDVTVFQFTDGNPNASASDFSAQVTLGDGNTVTLGDASPYGRIVAAGAGFDVDLSYTYNTTLENAPFSVQVNDIGGASASASGSVTVIPASSNPLVVTTTADDGPGSLRAAIEFVNSDPNDSAANPDVITFAIGSGAQTISLASALPAVLNPVVIDGTTQPGYSGVPLIEIDGSSIPDQPDGLEIDADSSTVTGLSVGGFGEYSLFLIGSSETVTGNYLGVDATGENTLSDYAGLVVLGSSDTIAGNVISGGQEGIAFLGTGATDNVVEGNFIGTDAAGTSALGNTIGIFFQSGPSGNTIGGVTAAARNVISGNIIGVEIDAGGVSTTGNVFEGNYVGTDVTGAVALANDDGFYLQDGASGNTIGGATPGAGNVISGNTNDGVVLTGNGTSGNAVAGNYIGTDYTGTTATGTDGNPLGNQGDGVLIENGASINVIGATTFNGMGGVVPGSGNVISGNRGDGVDISDSNINFVVSNFIGTDVSGTIAIGNGAAGVNIHDGASQNLIGADGSGAVADAAARNIISGNNAEGVRITDPTTSHNVVAGNYIGTDVTGEVALGNGGSGVSFGFSPSDNRVGTDGLSADDAGERNVISGNLNNGIHIGDGGTSGNLIAGNYIGLDAAGTKAIGNAWSGIILRDGADGNTIGWDGVGNAADMTNVISGNGVIGDSYNGQDGIRITDSGTSNNTIDGNYIGTDYTGTTAIGADNNPLGNAGDGVIILSGALNNTIGGTTAGDGNVITGNLANGVDVSGSGTVDNVVAGNIIGLNASGATVIDANSHFLGNYSEGVELDGGASGNTIGGATADAANIISGNSFDGVGLFTGANGNIVQGNRIGTDSTGGTALGNQGNGVTLTGAGGNSILGNQIASNAGEGVEIFGAVSTGNLVQGNLIGTNATGVSALGNQNNGVQIENGAADNTIGGTDPGDGNVISGNTGDGVDITDSGTTGNVVEGNYIGVDATGAAALANGGNGVSIINGASDNTIGGDVTGVQNIVAAGGVFASNYGVAIASNGDLIVSDPTNQQIVRVNAQTGAQTVISSGGDIGHPDGVAIAANGDIYVADPVNDSIIRVDPTTGAQTVISSGGSFVDPTDLAFAPDGNLYVSDAAAFGGLGAIFNLDLTTGAQTVITEGTSSSNPGVIAFDAKGDLFAVFGPESGVDTEVDQVNTTTGVRTVVSSGGLLVNAFGLAVAPDGSLLVANLSDASLTAAGNIVRIDPTTGTQTVAYSGGTLFVPSELAVASNGDAYVTNYADDTFNIPQVVRIAANAARNIISGNSGDGVDITGSGTTGNVVEGNYIGTDAAGTTALGNAADGVRIDGGSSGNTIGGLTADPGAGAGNVTSGNAVENVSLYGVNGNTVLGNILGLNAAGAGLLLNNASSEADGIEIVGSTTGNLIGGSQSGARNIISGNPGAGIWLHGSASGNTIAGNYVGTDVTGTVGLANQTDGIFFGIFNGQANDANTVGGAAAGAGNLISGNVGYGIYIEGASANNVFQGNFIGTNAAGTAALANAGDGVYVGAGASGNTIGGTTTGAGNIISGNTGDGVAFTSSGAGNVVEGNYIGLNAAGAAALGNGQEGIDIDANGVTIGGTAPGAGNVISGNDGDGIGYQTLVSSGLIEGNFIGTNAAGTGAVANTYGIAIGNSGGVTVGGTTAGAGNLISGNHVDGIIIAGGLNPTGNLVQDNLIGTDVTGSASLGNGAAGVHIFNDSNNVVTGNVISGNQGFSVAGVYINASSGSAVGADNNVVAGNFIGTNAAGTATLANAGAGVLLFSSAGAILQNNTIGGTTAADRNIISGNTGDGVGITGSGTTGNVVEGNFIGTDVTGNVALGNGGAGVNTLNYTGNTIGGPTAWAGNILSANNYGAEIGGTHDLVEGNYIGTNASGTAKLGNNYGVFISGGGFTTIGGVTAGARNIISGNSQGVVIEGSNTLIEGNYIGLDFTGAAALGNMFKGIDVGSGSNIQIGGTVAGAGNVISGNGEDGIFLGVGAPTAVIQGNLIGTDWTGTVGIGNSRGITVLTAGNTIGGATAGAGNVIADSSFWGIELFGSGATDNLVQGNYIGTDITGTIALGNSVNSGFAGIQIVAGAFDNTIGGTTTGAGNIISGNTGDGVDITGSGTTGNVVEGDYIGTNGGGTAALANGGDGVAISSAVGNTIGGMAAGAGNLISGNLGVGVAVNGTALPTGLVGLWNGNGNDADGVGGNNGTSVGGAGFTQGIVGQAFNFTGAGQAVVLNNAAALQTQNFTIDAWVNMAGGAFDTPFGPGGHILGYGNGGYGFGVLDDGELLLSKEGVSAVVSGLMGGQTVQVGQWTNVAVTVNNGVVTFYLNGVARPMSATM